RPPRWRPVSGAAPDASGAAVSQVNLSTRLGPELRLTDSRSGADGARFPSAMKVAGDAKLTAAPTTGLAEMFSPARPTEAQITPHQIDQVARDLTLNRLTRTLTLGLGEYTDLRRREVQLVKYPASSGRLANRPGCELSEVG